MYAKISKRKQLGVCEVTNEQAGCDLTTPLGRVAHTEVRQIHFVCICVNVYVCCV